MLRFRLCFRTTAAAVSMLNLTTPAAAQPSRLNAELLPVNLQHIQRQLNAFSIREERDGLNLRYFLNIYGQAPPLRLFTKDDNLTTGPVPFGAPTHQDFMNLWTPQEFRTPPLDFSTIIQWLSGQRSKTKPDGSR